MSPTRRRCAEAGHRVGGQASVHVIVVARTQAVPGTERKTPSRTKPATSRAESRSCLVRLTPIERPQFG